MSYTQGPWELSYDQGSTRDVISTKGSLPICTMRLSWITHEQYAANALLVAAAPELVEALKAFVSYDELADSGCCDVATMMAYAEAIEKARAALAKAGVG